MNMLLYYVHILDSLIKFVIDLMIVYVNIHGYLELKMYGLLLCD